MADSKRIKGKIADKKPLENMAKKIKIQALWKDTGQPKLRV
jgi:hypothetical protein